MTVGPTIEHPLPEGVSDTFTHSCECGADVQVVAGVGQSHDCPLTEAERQAIRDAAADELVGDGTDQAEQQTAQPQAVDPLQLASMLCVRANNVLAKRDNGGPVERQIALAQAIATIELAQATRAQYQLNVQMAQIAIDDRNQAIAKQAGPAGIVIPHLAPGRH